MFYAPTAFDEFDCKPVEQFGMRRQFATRAEIFGRRHQTLSEVLLPDAIDDHARGERVVFVHDPFRQSQPVRWRVFRKRMQRGGRARSHDIARTLPIATFENVCFAGHGASGQSQRRRAVRPLLHQFANLPVRVGERRINGAVITEDLAPLPLCSLIGGDRENTANRGGQRIGFRVRRVCDRKSETTDVRLALLGVNRVVALLRKLKRQSGAVVIVDALLNFKDQLTILISPDRPGVARPVGFEIPVNHVLRGRVGQFKIGGHIGKRDLFDGIRFIRWRGFDRKFAEIKTAVGSATRSAARQIRISQKLHANAGDIFQVRLRFDDVIVGRRVVAFGDERSVFQPVELHAERREDFAVLDRRPFHIVVARLGFPRGQTLRQFSVSCNQIVFDLCDLRQNLFALLSDLFVGDLNRRFVVVVHKRVEAVILRLRDRVEFVVVALSAIDRQAEERLADGVNAVNDAFDAELFWVNAAFLVEHRISQKARRHPVVQRGLRQQISR
ncbi:MAG: hypothetical protein JMDDDDMK_04795 [Acidobacteria bacterium]|nr:hypothetical protein [Acidobacteriota bacterium]